MPDTEHDRKHLIQQLTPEQRWQEWENYFSQEKQHVSVLFLDANFIL